MLRIYCKYALLGVAFCTISFGSALSQESVQRLPAATSGGDESGVDEKAAPFSGPQVGEEIGEAHLWVVAAGDKPSEQVDLAQVARDVPLAVAFMHEKARPSFLMARVLSKFAELRRESKLKLYVVVLSDDRSASEQWLKQINRYFELPTQLAVADGGMEGPGTLGLNRLVDMTIFVAKEGKVTANFALTQVSAATDGPAVLKAINDVTGGGDVPDVKELLPQPPAERMRQSRP